MYSSTLGDQVRTRCELINAYSCIPYSGSDSINNCLLPLEEGFWVTNQDCSTAVSCYIAPSDSACTVYTQGSTYNTVICYYCTVQHGISTLYYVNNHHYDLLVLLHNGEGPNSKRVIKNGIISRYMPSSVPPLHRPVHCNTIILLYIYRYWIHSLLHTHSAVCALS